MLKKSQIDLNQHEDRDGDKINVRNSKLENKSSILSFIVGSSNVKRWNALKIQFSCKTNEIFASKLLNLAQDYLNDKKNNKCKEKSVDEKCNGKTKKIKKNRIESIRKKLNDNKNAIQIDTNLNEKKTIFKLLNENKCQVEILEIKTGDTTITPVTVPQNTTKNDTIDSNNGKSNDKTKKKKICTASKEKQEVRKKVDFDVRKAPQLDSQTKVDVKNEVDPSAADMVQNDSKIKICKECNTRHNDNQCPINFPSYTIQDQISQDEWIQKFKSLFDDQIKLEKDTDNIKIDTTSYCFSQMSLPNILYLDDTNTKHGLGVFTNDEIKSFTQFGPLIGKGVKEVDIPEDFNMRDLWHFPSENGNNLYINTEDLEASNWMRYIRPAPTRDEKNLIVVMKNDEFHVVTTKVLYKGDELLYWQENALTTNKKKLEKTSCGGCNMNFAHPFYYRTHCSVFHDVRFSLTIRKYHCKVCGAAILGKENIMKHAVELHNGQGAYQCQYCKKFFLRLNYLEMHRTYGCSANPHRSRPLCDFCGRKFCQPQKLKVHIKRMHSDFSEVLKEFQCKNCLKILGSRAALQRHLKEVHQKQIAGAYCCSRCGKHFQNKSNLKIHMLTHSGIKPFKCTTVNCNAAFTTKQCLQFHYKKVHNFTEDSMPKIERSVDYTFQAYSGFEGELEKTDGSTNSQTNMQNDDEYGDSDDESFDNKSVDDPPALQSPLQVTDDQSSPISISPPIETYVSPPSNNVKVLTKGSKKWIGDQPLKSTDVYQMDHRLNKEDLSTIALHVQEPEMFDRSKLTNLSDFGRQEASNASLLVEAALDSVCSEPNIDIDVSSTPNCTDSIVNNLYNLAQPDDVTYSETVCMSEPRELNLISPSVNDHISVTDELNDELRHDQSINMDYSNFHQEEFSPANSPGIQHRSSFVRNYINNLSPHYNEPAKNISPVPSPPRYDFGHAVTNEHLSSDDSNGMAAQNLSLNNPKNDIQLDLSIYKSPYKFDIPNYQKKDFRLKYDIDIGDRKHILNNDNIEKHYGDNESSELEQEQVDSINQQHDLSNNMHSVDVEVKEIDVHEERLKYPDDLSSDIRNKFEIDLDMRLKNYEIDSEALRQRSSYEAADLDFRSKNYDLIDSIESRVKSYDNIETDFRSDRNFEPLVLNSSEIQGLDMSARSFHNYSNINRYHHLYPEVDRVDLRLNYSPPPPTYTHADLLRVVSLDLTPPGRHSVDLSLRSHSLHQIANTRLLTDHTIHQTNTHRLLDQSRLLSTDLSTTRHLSAGESRLITESSTGRILSDHTTSRILANDQLATNHLLSSDQSRLLSDETRLLSEQPRLLEQSRLIGDSRILPPTTPSGPVSPVPTFSGYGVSQSPFHPPSLQSRSHVTSPTPPSYHHYSSYY